MPVLNPRRMWATLPAQRTNGQPVVAENIHLQAGLSVAGGQFEVFAQEGDDGITREENRVLFDLENVLRPLLPEGASVIGARTVEARPDIVTDQFPQGVDLYSTWAIGSEILVANPPVAPADLEVA